MILGAWKKLWGLSPWEYLAIVVVVLGKYQHRRQALLDLADSANDPFLRMALGTARSCHANFYNDWMEQEELEGYLPTSRPS